MLTQDEEELDDDDDDDPDMDINDGQFDEVSAPVSLLTPFFFPLFSEVFVKIRLTEVCVIGTVFSSSLTS